jgi:benzylsuccinate CoA-transferase BbsF subunit
MHGLIITERTVVGGLRRAAVRNSPECHDDAQLRALGHFAATQHVEYGRVELEGPRYHLSATPGAVGAAPTLGQHLVPVLRDILGYSDDRIAELVAAGAPE